MKNKAKNADHAPDEQPEALTAKKDVDFSEWYNQVLSVAGVLDKRYDVKGMYVWLNYGFELMRQIRMYWDQIYREAGIKEMYFPLLVPLSYAQMNKSWFDGFKDEAFWVKGAKEEKAQHILRPTGEPAIYPMFKLWTRTHGDLPIRMYETVSSFRYETKHTRPIIRDREITMWFEIHTAHATKEEAEQEVKLHEKLYSMIWKRLALPHLRVRKPQWECFPGAIGALEDYTIMPNGKAMENGSINNLGQAYAKEFGITFKDKAGKEQHVWQVCTGNGARYLAAVISIHGDDKGLVIPPVIAPIQVAIVPIYYKDDKETIIAKALDLARHLVSEGVRVHVDLREDTPGSKFYDWEIKGIPLRIELGPRDVQNNAFVLARRDTGKKETVKQSDLIKAVRSSLDQIQHDLYVHAEKQFKSHLVHATDIKKIVSLVNDQKKVVQCFWCGSEKCYDTVKELGEGIDPFGTDVTNTKEGICIVCGKKAKEFLCISNTY